ncbi:MAG: hypothetical protein JWO09_1593 [Bacteroidetes bacterium]|nr:hypothetical protein [Bacteroidota bacterium]
MTLRKALKPVFFITAIYSILVLPAFAAHAGGSCNAGVALIGIGFFLIICSVLTFIAVYLITKHSQTTKGRTTAKVLSVIAAVIWGFWTIGVITDEPLAGAAYFLPFFSTTVITCRLAYTEPVNNIKANDKHA